MERTPEVPASIRDILSLSGVLLFCDLMDSTLPGSSVHGILQAKILEWVAISFSRGSSLLRNRGDSEGQGSLVCCSPSGSSVHGILQAKILEWVAIPFSRGSSWPRIELRSTALLADSLPSALPGEPESQGGGRPPPQDPSPLRGSLGRKPPRAPQLEETPETPPFSRAEGLLFLCLGNPMDGGAW